MMTRKSSAQKNPAFCSIVTYAWYRFIDQPALQGLKLDAEQRTLLQARAVLMQKLWSEGGEFKTFDDPTAGKLVTLDPAMIVTPPSGKAFGYVPVVLGQHLAP